MQTIMTRREIAEALGIKYPYQLQRVLPDLRKFGAFKPKGLSWRMNKEDFDRYIEHLKTEKE